MAIDDKLYEVESMEYDKAKLYNMLLNPEDSSLKYFAFYTGKEYLLFPWNYALGKDITEVHYN